MTIVRGLHDFASNDYLGFSQNQPVRERLMAELRAGCPLGSTGSRLLTGHTERHQLAEDFLAKKFRSQAALVFSSGYLANLAVTGALVDDSTAFFSDELNHASLIDGMRLTKASRYIFRHNDIDDLRLKLEKSVEKSKVIVTESLFSQEGDFSPVTELCELAKKYDAWLVVDEAHATGVYGANGLGVTENLKRFEKFVTLHACGKALGAQGAFVTCSQFLKDRIVNRARSFIFSTGLSPFGARHIQFAVEELLANPGPRLRLQKNIREFTRMIGFGESQIVPVILGSNERAVAAQELVMTFGFDVRAIRSPTVAPGSERLRVTIKSFHSQHVLKELAERIAELRGAG